MDDENLFSKTFEFVNLQNLDHKKQLEDELKTQMELLNSMKECFTVLKEITSLPNTFCHIVAQRDEKFLEIDRKGGKCLRDVKKNVLETFSENIHDSCEIKIPDDLEQSVEECNLEMQEQKEKHKTWKCLLGNCRSICDDNKSNEIINIDNISCIKSDSEEIQARDLFMENSIDMDDSNRTIKDTY